MKQVCPHDTNICTKHGTKAQSVAIDEGFFFFLFSGKQSLLCRCPLFLQLSYLHHGPVMQLCLNVRLLHAITATLMTPVILTRHIVLSSPHQASLSFFPSLCLSFCLPPHAVMLWIQMCFKNLRHHPPPLPSLPSNNPSIHPSLHLGVISSFDWIYNHLEQRQTHNTSPIQKVISLENVLD